MTMLSSWHMGFELPSTRPTAPNPAHKGLSAICILGNAPVRLSAVREFRLSDYHDFVACLSHSLDRILTGSGFVAMLGFWCLPRVLPACMIHKIGRASC